MVSVIVPVYNTEKYLHRCIDSILTQTYTDFELLLIDDGSTDNSGKICDEYTQKDSRVRVFHKENGGVSSARNLGLDEAKGEWISFVDSDDYVLPTYLATYFELMQNETDLCILGIIPDYSKSVEYKILRTSFDYIGNVKDALLLLNACQMVGSLCNKLFKTTIIGTNQLRLNMSFKYREDEEFFLRYISCIQNVAATKKNEYVYIVPCLSKYNNTDNLLTLMSMYDSVVRIFIGKANIVTDNYQIELCNEWLALLRNNKLKAVAMLPKVLAIIGSRVFRVSPFNTTCDKIRKFIK